MTQEEAYQIQRGDYFLCHGETVKVVGYNPYDENDYSVVNKNGSKFYAEVEELEPIVINSYTLERAGFEPHGKNYSIKKKVYVVMLNGEIEHLEGVSKNNAADYIGICIQHFHVLQNALRLFGEEVELKL